MNAVVQQKVIAFSSEAVPLLLYLCIELDTELNAKANLLTAVSQLFEIEPALVQDQKVYSNLRGYLLSIFNKHYIYRHCFESKSLLLYLDDFDVLKIYMTIKHFSPGKSHQ